MICFAISQPVPRHTEHTWIPLAKTGKGSIGIALPDRLQRTQGRQGGRTRTLPTPPQAGQLESTAPHKPQFFSSRFTFTEMTSF